MRRDHSPRRAHMNVSGSTMRDQDWPEFLPKHARTADEAANHWELLPDRELVFAMRRGDQRALEEYFRRFQPLLRRCALRAGLTADQANDAVMEILESTAARLSSWESRIPACLGAYLRGAMRHQSAETLRTATDENSRGEPLYPEVPHAPIVLASVSEYARRASRGPAPDPERLSSAIRRLAEAIEEGISEEEYTMLMWMGNDISCRQIAEWLGTEYEATRKRSYRLRVRLKDAVRSYAAHLSPAERGQIARLLDRAERADERAGHHDIAERDDGR